MLLQIKDDRVASLHKLNQFIDQHLAKGSDILHHKQIDPDA